MLTTLSPLVLLLTTFGGDVRQMALQLKGRKLPPCLRVHCQNLITSMEQLEKQVGKMVLLAGDCGSESGGPQSETYCGQPNPGQGIKDAEF